jgi:hypothetical protein
VFSIASQETGLPDFLSAGLPRFPNYSGGKYKRSEHITRNLLCLIRLANIQYFCVLIKDVLFTGSN